MLPSMGLQRQMTERLSEQQLSQVFSYFLSTHSFSTPDMLGSFNFSNMSSMLLLEPKVNAVPLPLVIYSLINASTHKVKV